jgi:glucose-6-phosphate isomerase
MTAPRCDRTPTWSLLETHAEKQGRSFDVRHAFVTDPGRVDAFSQEAPHLFADLSKNRIDAETEGLLFQLARDCQLEAQRDAMLRGEPINSTEGRAVLHTLLRVPEAANPAAAVIAEKSIRNNPDRKDARALAATEYEANNLFTGTGALARDAAEPAAPETEVGVISLDAARADVLATRAAMLEYAERVRDDIAITDVINIGIGGSDLGPQMAVLALEQYRAPGKRFHFVSNVDGHELSAVLRQVRPANTLFLIASKTFTTAETMTNAASARAWFVASGGTDIASHFAALTTNVEAARSFGIETTFGFWDWVGGRYSLWSSIGLPLAIAIGAQAFRDFLAGAHAMDEHFRSAPLESNLPVRLGLLDVWYRNFLGFTSRCVAPYHHALRRLPAYLQQLEMESNGKRVDREGAVLPFATSPVVWGEPGTNGQHAFFQMLHQGTDVIPAEFIAVRDAAHDLPGHHEQLLANALAQAQALMQGQEDAGGHRDFPGNRPSTFFVLEQLDPKSLGALIALYEHRVFVSGAIWGINSFDQWGVELGKMLAKDIAPRFSTGDTRGLDASTAALVARLRH